MTQTAKEWKNRYERIFNKYLTSTSALTEQQKQHEEEINVQWRVIDKLKEKIRVRELHISTLTLRLIKEEELK